MRYHRRSSTRIRAQAISDWHAGVLRTLNVRVWVLGERPETAGHLWLANHISWLDIPLLGALVPQTVFLSKAEVKSWPIIGTLAVGVGTLFMARGAGSDAARVALTEALQRNHQVVVFPEGTTTEGHEVRHFHARLTQPALDAPAAVQPVALRYFLNDGRADRRTAYIGDDSLLGSIWRILCVREIQVTVQFLETIPHSPPSPAVILNRNHIARLAEQRVRAALQNWKLPRAE